MLRQLIERTLAGGPPGLCAQDTPTASSPKVADSICSMELYRQDAEMRLLSALMMRLERRSLIDVGAERGGLADGMLRAGVEQLHAFDPHPDNARALHARFDTDARVTVHEYAVSDDDGHGELHVSSSLDGSQLSYGHTLLERVDTDEIVWAETVTVTRRSLESLVASAEIPRRVGILKIDTEGHDLAVVRGMGMLEADVVMVEHWTDLPAGLGICPWTTEDMVAALRARGFSHFAFIVHRGEFVTLKWDDGEVQRGAMGNLVFLHDRVLEHVLPDVLECAGWLAEQAVRVGQTYMQAAHDRLALVDELKQAADDRSVLLDELTQALDDRSVRAQELEQAASDRLALVDELREAAEARLQALESTTAQLRDKSAELDALKGQRVDDRA
jgi:FkbM family methyltransferase